MKSPQQQIYDACFKTSEGLGYSTFSYLPAKETEYPFVFVGEQFDDDVATKSVIYGNVVQRIHFYHDHKKRTTLTSMMDAIKREIRKLKHTETFYINIKKIRSQTLPDNSAAQALLHGIIEIEFRFN